MLCPSHWKEENHLMETRSVRYVPPEFFAPIIRISNMVTYTKSYASHIRLSFTYFFFCAKCARFPGPYEYFANILSFQTTTGNIFGCGMFFARLHHKLNYVLKASQ